MANKPIDQDIIEVLYWCFGVYALLWITIQLWGWFIVSPPGIFRKWFKEMQIVGDSCSLLFWFSLLFSLKGHLLSIIYSIVLVLVITTITLIIVIALINFSIIDVKDLIKAFTQSIQDPPRIGIANANASDVRVIPIRYKSWEGCSTEIDLPSKQLTIIEIQYQYDLDSGIEQLEKKAEELLLDNHLFIKYLNSFMKSYTPWSAFKGITRNLAVNSEIVDDQAPLITNQPQIEEEIIEPPRMVTSPMDLQIQSIEFVDDLPTEFFVKQNIGELSWFQQNILNHSGCWYVLFAFFGFGTIFFDFYSKMWGEPITITLNKKLSSKDDLPNHWATSCTDYHFSLSNNHSLSSCDV